MTHRLALCATVPLAAAGFLAFAGPVPQPVPSPPAITDEVLNWLGTPIYYRIEPAPDPLSRVGV